MKKRGPASGVSYSPVCGQRIATRGILGPLSRGREGGVMEAPSLGLHGGPEEAGRALRDPTVPSASTWVELENSRVASNHSLHIVRATLTDSLSPLCIPSPVPETE